MSLFTILENHMEDHCLLLDNCIEMVVQRLSHTKPT